jgi:hypothetical protein
MPRTLRRESRSGLHTMRDPERVRNQASPRRARQDKTVQGAATRAIVARVQKLCLGEAVMEHGCGNRKGDRSRWERHQHRLHHRQRWWSHGRGEPVGGVAAGQEELSDAWIFVERKSRMLRASRPAGVSCTERTAAETILEEGRGGGRNI